MWVYSVPGAGLHSMAACVSVSILRMLFVAGPTRIDVLPCLTTPRVHPLQVLIGVQINHAACPVRHGSIIQGMACTCTCCGRRPAPMSSLRGTLLCPVAQPCQQQGVHQLLQCRNPSLTLH
jgi:hypothetical protein